MNSIYLRTSSGKMVNILESIKDSNSIYEYFQKGENWLPAVLDTFNKSVRYDDIIKNINKDSVVLDLGANVGLFSLYIKDKCKTVYAVEPTPTHFEILMKLTEGTNIVPIKAAITDKTEEVPLFKSESNTTQNGLIPIGFATSLGKVQGYSMEDLLKYINVDKIDFCKIDIEGYEDSLFRSEKLENSLDKIKEFFIETHGAYDYVGDKIIEVLSKHNFICKRPEKDIVLAEKKYE